MQGIGKEKFGEIYQNIQAQYGGKPEKPREAKKTLDKDDFLRIMMTQMQHQDPTSPLKADQMASEIAQFTSVEQLQNVNQNLSKMAQQQKPFEKLVMSQMLGKNVTVDRSQFFHQKGESESLRFHLPQKAKSVDVEIYNARGEPVFEKNLGTQDSGVVQFSWDNASDAQSGSYVFRVQAKDETGKTIALNSKTQERVIGLSFEGQEPIFLVGDAKKHEKVTLQNIIHVHASDQENAQTEFLRQWNASQEGFPHGLGKT